MQVGNISQRLPCTWLYAVNMQPRALSNRHHAADATIGSHGPASQSITTKECLCGARCAVAGRAFRVSARNTFNSCLSLVKKFHTTYGTPSRNLGTQHIFFRAGIGCFTVGRGPFESVPVRAKQQCSYFSASGITRHKPEQGTRRV